MTYYTKEAGIPFTFLVSCEEVHRHYLSRSSFLSSTGARDIVADYLMFFLFVHERRTMYARHV
jgi:hypothetical protein